MKKIWQFFKKIFNFSSPFDYRSLILPGRYRHFKGNIYFVWGVGKHSETGEELVVYGPEYRDGLEEDSKRIWLRPAHMFIEDVNHKGTLVPRFKKI